MISLRELGGSPWTRGTLRTRRVSLDSGDSANSAGLLGLGGLCELGGSPWTRGKGGVAQLQ
jgi:hypothetical protein